MAVLERAAIRAVDGSTVSPSLPLVPGFEHFTVDTGDLQSLARHHRRR